MNSKYCFIFLLCSLLIPTVYPSLIQIIQNDNCIGGAASYNCTLTGPVNTGLTGVNINISNIIFALAQVQSSLTINGIDMSHFSATVTNMGLDLVLNTYSHIEVIINITNIIAEYRNIAIGCRLASDPSNSANTQFPLPSPPAATSINATTLGAVCGVRLNWTASYTESPITNYTLYQNGTVINTTNATSQIIAQLTARETYNYTVLASTCVGSSLLSEGAVFTASKDAGISATNCAAIYDAMSRNFTLVFTPPIQNYPISYIINISSASSTQLFTPNSTVLTTPPYTTVLMLDTTYNYTSSITAILHCPSASNVTCSTDVTIIPIPTTTTATATTTTTAPVTTTTTYSASSVTNTNISSTSDLPITNVMDTTYTNSIVSGSSTISMQTDTYIDMCNATADSSPVHILFPLTIVLLIVWILLMVIVCTFISCFLLSRVRFV